MFIAHGHCPKASPASPHLGYQHMRRVRKLECEKQLQCAQSICNPYPSPAYIRELFPQLLEQFFLTMSFCSSLSAFQHHVQTNGFSTPPSASSLISRRCRPPTRLPTMPLTDQSMGPSSFPLPSHLDAIFSSHSPCKLRQPRIF